MDILKTSENTSYNGDKEPDINQYIGKWLHNTWNRDSDSADLVEKWADKLFPMGIPEALCTGIKDGWLIMEYDYGIFTMRPWEGITIMPNSEFIWGDSVQDVKQPDLKGIIDRIEWDSIANEYKYYIQCYNRKPNPKHYIASELQPYLIPQIDGMVAITNVREISKEGYKAYLETRLYKYRARGNINGLYRRDQSRSEVYKVINSSNKGIEWEYQNKTITLFSDTYVTKTKYNGETCNYSTWIYGFPSLDLKYMIVLHINDPSYPGQANLVVYNADGSIHIDAISPPIHLGRRGRKNVDSSSRFIQFSWHYCSEQGKYKNAILFGRWSYEEELREFDPETGKFGALLDYTTPNGH